MALHRVKREIRWPAQQAACQDNEGDILKALTFIGAILIGATQFALPALAQEFPKKQPIKIVVPVPPGGGTDTLARIGADFLQRRLGQAVVVENRPGASSTIGSDYVAKAPADGYTLLFTGGELAVVPAVRANMPYKFEDFTYLVRPFSVPVVLVASPKLPVSNTAELVTHMKANPGKVRYGTTGVGAIVHMGFALFEGAAGVKGTHIPYPGSGPIYTDMLGGNVDVTIGLPPFIDGIKILGSTGKSRHPALPNAPMLEEFGIKGASWDVWFGLLAPPKLPKPIADRLIQEWTAMMKDPEVLAKFATAKWAPEANPLTADDFKKAALEDYKGWKTVAEREKIVVQQ
jgi:tripartite-type tricarboxylate transporter receptor subunit TctC